MTKRISRTAKKPNGKNGMPFTADAILTLDPASTGLSGLALRRVDRMFTPGQRRLRPPVWTACGHISNGVMRDDLGEQLSQIVPRGGRVCFAANATAFRGVSGHIFRAIGSIEGLLHDLNVFEGFTAEEIQDASWRVKIYSKEDRDRIKATPDSKRRKALKDLAIATVKERHGLELDDNAAEAVLLNDFVCLHRADIWMGVNRDLAV